MLEKAMKEHDYQEGALLEILHKAQELYGYLSKDLLMELSGSLNLPPSHVFGVATFYNYFKFKPLGEHLVTACLGTACYVKGVEEIIIAIEREFNLKRGESTADGKLSLLVTRCIGACAMAPNMMVDGAIAIVSSMNFYAQSSAGVSWEAGLVSMNNEVVESITSAFMRALADADSVNKKVS
jgi:bidirectional [NiFe] hydrogenase diaphorase subunit